MPDGRSLCDRRARVRAPDPVKMSDQEFDEYVDEQRNAPVCGSCVLLAQHLQHQAATLYESHGGSVHPATPTQGWRDVGDTRWSMFVDIPAFLETPGLDEQLKYERIKQGVAPHRLEEWIERDRRETEEYFARLRQMRADRDAE